MKSKAAAWLSESYNSPTHRADRAQMIFQGPPSAPRISMNFLSLISGKMVDRWFSQSFRLGFSPAHRQTCNVRQRQADTDTMDGCADRQMDRQTGMQAGRQRDKIPK